MTSWALSALLHAVHDDLHGLPVCVCVCQNGLSDEMHDTSVAQSSASMASFYLPCATS